MSSSVMLEPLYVIDTHALFWYLTKDTKLTANAAALFDAAEHGDTRLVISAIVLAELFYLNQKLGAFEDFSTTYNDIVSKPYFKVEPFVASDVLNFERDAKIPEMHDRIIVGLARRLGAPLITRDEAITKSGVIETVW